MTTRCLASAIRFIRFGGPGRAMATLIFLSFIGALSRRQPPSQQRRPIRNRPALSLPPHRRSPGVAAVPRNRRHGHGGLCGLQCRRQQEEGAPKPLKRGAKARRGAAASVRSSTIKGAFQAHQPPDPAAGKSKRPDRAKQRQAPPGDGHKDDQDRSGQRLEERVQIGAAYQFESRRPAYLRWSRHKDRSRARRNW